MLAPLCRLSRYFFHIHERMNFKKTEYKVSSFFLWKIFPPCAIIFPINNRFLSIGIQDFEKLRNFNNIYIDKTSYIYELARTSTPYFLSLPHRFGKSLLLSTIEYYFRGKKRFVQRSCNRKS